MYVSNKRCRQSEKYIYMLKQTREKAQRISTTAKVSDTQAGVLVRIYVSFLRNPLSQHQKRKGRKW